MKLSCSLSLFNYALTFIVCGYNLIIMSDFTYDSYDSSALKVAFSNLQAAERQGFWMGLVIGSPMGVWLVSRPQIQHKFNAGPATKLFSALFVGSLMYE